MKIRRTRKQSAPRNLAARALRSPLFRAKVAKSPKAYRRGLKKVEPPPPEEE